MISDDKITVSKSDNKSTYSSCIYQKSKLRAIFDDKFIKIGEENKPKIEPILIPDATQNSQWVVTQILTLLV